MFTWFLVAYWFRSTSWGLAKAVWLLPNAPRHEVATSGSADVFAEIPVANTEETGDDSIDANAFLVEAKKVYNKYVPDEPEEMLEVPVERKCSIKPPAVLAEFCPRLLLHHSQLKAAEGRDLKYWSVGELKAWLTARDVNFDGWVFKVDLETHVSKTRGTSPNWEHLRVKCLPPTVKRETLWARFLRRFRLARGRRLVKQGDNDLVRIAKAKEEVDTAGAQVEEDENKLGTCKADEERLSQIAAGHQQKLDVNVQEIAELQENIDANSRAIAKQQERKKVLDEQAKKASADRQKGLQSQSAQVKMAIGRYERHNKELRGLQQQQKEKQKPIAAELDAANHHLDDRRKDVKAAEDIVQSSKSDESTSQKRFEEYTAHLDGVIQDLAELLDTMSLHGRDGDVIEDVAAIMRGHRRLMAAVAKANGKELDTDDELDELIGPVDQQDEALLGDVHEDIGEGWVRIMPAGGGKPYYANAALSRSQYAHPFVSTHEVPEEDEQMMLVPAVAVPGDVPGAMESDGASGLTQPPPHELSKVHEEHRIVLPKVKDLTLRLDLDDDGYVKSTYIPDDKNAAEVRPGTKIVAVNGVAVANSLDIGTQIRLANQQVKETHVELTIIPWHASGWAPAASKFSRATKLNEDQRKYKLTGHQKVVLERRDVFRGVARSALDLGHLYSSAPARNTERPAVNVPEHKRDSPEVQREIERAAQEASDRELAKFLQTKNKQLFARSPGDVLEGPPNWVDGSRARTG